MKPKLYVLLAVLMIAVMILSSCAAPAAAPEEPEEDYKGAVAAVLTGPWNDNSWNNAAYDALMELEARGVRVAYSESVAEGDEERVLRQYAEDGFDLIVGHSFGYMDGVFNVAEEYPDVNFAWAGGIGVTAKNVADYEQNFYDAAYPIGIIAAHVTETGVLGALYGFDIPVCHAMGVAMLEGAQSVNPDISLVTAAVGDWIDVAKAKEAALAQADAGVDFWIECGEGPALGAIAAAEEVGGYVTGYVGDMSGDGPNVVLINLIWNMEPIFSEMLRMTLDGTFDNPLLQFGVQEGAMLFTVNENLKDVIPAEALEAANEAMELIRTGELVVEFVPQ